MKPIIIFNGACALAAAALALGLSVLSCQDGRGLLSPPGDRTWVAIEPVQCLGNPWEKDWLSRYGDMGPYPGTRGAEERIVREYYARFGVEVGEVISIPKYRATCEACSCPRGDVLYLSVRDSDVEKMLRLGFRRESPRPFPAPPDTILPGAWTYTGYDSSGAIPLIRGTLTFLRPETTSVSGSWVLRGEEGYGPQIGQGTFTGYVDGDMIGLNLNPGWVDNSVFLHGRKRGGIIEGSWDVVTIAGVVYTGRFTATKQD